VPSLAFGLHRHHLHTPDNCALNREHPRRIATIGDAKVALKAASVFTPNDYPTHTYIKRSGEDLEERLRQASATPKLVVSVSGPSKSGKTVLVERVIGQDNIIPVSGALIKAPDELWTLVLNWIESPAATATQLQKTETDQNSATSGLTGKIPYIVEASGQTALTHSETTTSAETSTVNRVGMIQVIKEIADSEFLIFVDDFHYMSREVQAEVAKQIKAAAERGVRICVASVEPTMWCEATRSSAGEQPTSILHFGIKTNSSALQRQAFVHSTSK
jgi:hypothetical protein